MDLIEVLWKQDVDLGYVAPNMSTSAQEKLKSLDLNDTKSEPTTSLGSSNDEIEKLKTVKAINNDNVQVSVHSS